MVDSALLGQGQGRDGLATVAAAGAESGVLGQGQGRDGLAMVAASGEG